MYFFRGGSQFFETLDTVSELADFDDEQEFGAIEGNVSIESLRFAPLEPLRFFGSEGERVMEGCVF